MNLSPGKLFLRLVTVALVAGLTGCCSLFWHPGCAPNIVTQPHSQVALKGTSVTFSVVTSPSTNVYYQWQFNNVDIAGATSSSYTIPSVDFVNVGDYRVLVWGSPTNKSKTAYLSVYALTGNEGTLQTPIGWFSAGGAPCSAAFNQAYTPHDDGTPPKPYLFYGPNASPQSGPFVNQHTPPLTRLTIDTFDCANAPADTGILFQNNFVPPPANPTPNCNDNAPDAPPCNTTGAKLGPLTLSTAAGPISQKNTYRVTVLYKNPPAPTSGNVTLHWQYSP